MRINYIFTIYLLQEVFKQVLAERQKRYLLFTSSTQWGVFMTVSIPLPDPESLVSVAWFFEANYYNVANATYFEPLLGDVEIASLRQQRNVQENNEIITRRSAYIFIESMLENHGYAGRGCLLRAICESGSLFLHNGVLGDLLHLVLTPSSSMAEDDVDDCYYEAEYWSLENNCEDYTYECPINPIDNISVNFE